MASGIQALLHSPNTHWELPSCQTNWLDGFDFFFFNGVKWHETVESRDRQININYQYLQYSVSAVVEVHAECPDGQRGTDLHLRLGQPARIRGGGDPRGPQSGWAYASWRVSLVQNQQNKARPTWVSPSQDRHPFSIDS